MQPKWFYIMAAVCFFFTFLHTGGVFILNEESGPAIWIELMIVFLCVGLTVKLVNNKRDGVKSSIFRNVITIFLWVLAIFLSFPFFV